MKMRVLSLVLVSAACLVLAGCSKKTPKDGSDNANPGEVVTPMPPYQPSEPAANPANATEPGDIESDTARLERELNPVFFQFDKYDLSQESRDTLTRNAQALRDTPGFNVVVEGHCDERGTNEYNLALGDRRARAARDFLVSSGIPASRFTIVSYGEERPFAYGHDESSWSQNRRAHFRVPELGAR